VDIEESDKEEDSEPPSKKQCSVVSVPKVESTHRINKVEKFEEEEIDIE